MDNCLFCKIVRGEIPSSKVYEDDTVLAFRDIEPQAPVHVLLIPKEHFDSILEVDEKTFAHMKTVVKKLHRRKRLPRRHQYRQGRTAERQAPAFPHPRRTQHAVASGLMKKANTAAEGIIHPLPLFFCPKSKICLFSRE